MDNFMELQVIQKGALYFCDCGKCGATIWTHEWITDDHNEVRDAMQAGNVMLACPDGCYALPKPGSFYAAKRSYAGRLSAPGYLDCTEWEFDTNKRRLMCSLRSM